MATDDEQPGQGRLMPEPWRPQPEPFHPDPYYEDPYFPDPYAKL
jgi:hypothetical protein